MDNLNASAEEDILDNVMLPTLWQHFEKGLFYSNMTVHKARATKTWFDGFTFGRTLKLRAMTSTPSRILEMTKNGKCKPGLMFQIHGLTS